MVLYVIFSSAISHYVGHGMFWIAIALENRSKTQTEESTRAKKEGTISNYKIALHVLQSNGLTLSISHKPRFAVSRRKEKEDEEVERA